VNAWLNFHTILAFLLGVMLSAWAKGLVSSAKGKLGA
jgi:hypothetical protein